MTKTAQEFEDLNQYIENEIAFYIDYFKDTSSINKSNKAISMHNIAKNLVDKVEESKIPKEQKAEMIELINQRMKYSEIG